MCYASLYAVAALLCPVGFLCSVPRLKVTAAISAKSTPLRLWLSCSKLLWHLWTGTQLLWVALRICFLTALISPCSPLQYHFPTPTNHLSPPPHFAFLDQGAHISPVSTPPGSYQLGASSEGQLLEQYMGMAWSCLGRHQARVSTWASPLIHISKLNPFQWHQTTPHHTIGCLLFCLKQGSSRQWLWTTFWAEGLLVLNWGVWTKLFL